jgi:hypothetical protein
MTRSRLSDGELAALAARIQQDYDYDERSGLLVNRKTCVTVRGRKDCKRNGKWRYLRMLLTVNGREYNFYSHHVVWAWHHGRFPTMQIDHVNGNGFDNHIGNLREVSPSENMRNMVYPWKPNADTGLPGVCKLKKVGYQIAVAQKRYYFRDRFEAFYHLTLLGRRFKLEVRSKR